MASRSGLAGLRICVCLVFVSFWARVGGAPQEASAQGAESPSLNVAHRALDNGLQVYVAANHTVPLATVLLAVRTGAFSQGPDERGVAHLFEHLLFRAYGDEPTDFGREAASFNATYNGATGEHVVTYYLILPSEEVDKAIRLLARLMTRVRLTKSDLSAELPVVLDELSRTASDPERHLARAVGLRFWSSGWHKKDVLGDSLSLSAVTVDDLRQRFERFYVPNNAALMVSGDVDVEDVFKNAADRFDDWRAGPEPSSGTIDHPEPPTASSVVVLSADVREALLSVRIAGPGSITDSESQSAAEAVAALLNDPSSGFQDRLVLDGPFEQLSCDFVRAPGSGAFVFSGTTLPGGISEAAAKLVDELDHLASHLDGQQSQATLARKQWALSRALLLERGALLAPYLADVWGQTTGDPATIELAALPNVPVSEMTALAEAYLQRTPLVMGAVVPEYLQGTVLTRLIELVGQR